MVDKLGLLVSRLSPVMYQKPRMFGVELEMELSIPACVNLGVDRHEVALEIRDALPARFVVIKEDGSLLINGHYANGACIAELNKPTGPKYAGFEVVTVAAGIRAHRAAWPKLAEIKSFGVLRAWDTESCAMHVHVSRNAMSSLQIGKILVLINHQDNRLIVQKIAGRSARKYSSYHDPRISDVVNAERVMNKNGEWKVKDQMRRVAVNLSNANTIEFRIFRGTVNPRHVIRNIEFVDAVCDYTNPAVASTSEMSIHRFLEYVSVHRQRWPLFAEWLGKHELISCRKVPDFVNPGALAINPTKVEEAEIKVDGQYQQHDGAHPDDINLNPAAALRQPRQAKPNRLVPMPVGVPVNAPGRLVAANYVINPAYAEAERKVMKKPAGEGEIGLYYIPEALLQKLQPPDALDNLAAVPPEMGAKKKRKLGVEDNG